MTDLSRAQRSVPASDFRDDLAHAIGQGLMDCGKITPDILNFIETTLFPVQADRLALFLGSDDTARDSLLLLMFSPDEAAQCHIESILATAPCTPDEEAVLKDHFLAQTIRIPVFLPESGLLSEMAVPAWAISNYMRPLRLSRKLPDQLEAVIRTALPAALSLVVRVVLRNSSLALTRFHEVVLCRFFERIPAPASASELESVLEFRAMLNALLDVLAFPDTTGKAESGGSVSLYDRLMQAKQTLLAELHQSQRTARLLRQSTLETLMSQGIRSVSGDCDDLRVRIGRMDRLCLVLTDRALPQGVPAETQVRTVDMADFSAMLLD